MVEFPKFQCADGGFSFEVIGYTKQKEHVPSDHFCIEFGEVQDYISQYRMVMKITEFPSEGTAEMNFPDDSPEEYLLDRARSAINRVNQKITEHIMKDELETDVQMMWGYNPSILVPKESISRLRRVAG